MAGQLRGCTEPRIFTPPLRELTPETSLGFAAIEFAKDVCEISLYPWQEWLLQHALEILEDGSFRYRTVVVLVARQQGKSMLSVVLSLFFLYVLGTRLVIGTAQDLDVAEEIWQEAVDLVEENEELNALKSRIVKVNGKKSLDLVTGERYKVKAANRRAGRGLSGDLILLDELREHQSWDSWGAVTHTAMARPNAQIWALSNAGDATSIVLRYLRKMAHKALGDPDGINAADDPSLLLEASDAPEEVEEAANESLGLFEWSSPPDSDIADRQGWAHANPALGYGLVTERSLASAMATDPEWVFRTECLCQWTDGSLEGPFPPGVWDAGIDPDSQIVGDVSPCVAVSWDRTKAHIAFAGRRADGKPHVEIVASRAGTEWVVPWLGERRERLNLKKIAIQTSGPAGSLADPLSDEGFEVVDWSGSEIGRGCGNFYDLVRGDPESGEPCGDLRHLPQPILDVAAGTAVTRPMGEAWAWDLKKSPVDAAPLAAATGAVWMLGKPVERPVGSYYDDPANDLVVC